MRAFRGVSRGLSVALVGIVAGCESNPASPSRDVMGSVSSPPAGALVVPQAAPLAEINGVTIQHGGYGSALAADPGDPNVFYSLTDRGPNVTISCGGQSVLGFPVPGFNPEIEKFRLSGTTLTLESTIHLKKANGTPLRHADRNPSPCHGGHAPSAERWWVFYIDHPWGADPLWAVDRPPRGA